MGIENDLRHTSLMAGLMHSYMEEEQRQNLYKDPAISKLCVAVVTPPNDPQTD